jgi:phage/plasmid primase-like uncharacterized protein
MAVRNNEQEFLSEVDVDRIASANPGIDIPVDPPDMAQPLPPEAEFAQRLREAGLNLCGQMPIMDGKLHHVPLLDRPVGRDGSYKGSLDGRPSGWFKNFITGEIDRWEYSGQKRTG